MILLQPLPYEVLMKQRHQQERFTRTPYACNNLDHPVALCGYQLSKIFLARYYHFSVFFCGLPHIFDRKDTYFLSISCDYSQKYSFCTFAAVMRMLSELMDRLSFYKGRLLEIRQDLTCFLLINPKNLSRIHEMREIFRIFAVRNRTAFLL